MESYVECPECPECPIQNAQNATNAHDMPPTLTCFRQKGPPKPWAHRANWANWAN